MSWLHTHFLGVFGTLIWPVLIATSLVDGKASLNPNAKPITKSDYPSAYWLTLLVYLAMFCVALKNVIT